MSYFKEAFNHTSVNEGGWVNDPLDNGGETYKGISRNHHSDWDGWTMIDEIKNTFTHLNKPELVKQLNIILNSNIKLQEMVESFYWKFYFSPFNGDMMPKRLAMEMYDTSVNLGVSKAVMFLQSTLNILSGDNYTEIVVDGKYGVITDTTLYKCLSKEKEENLVKCIDIQQGMHYINIVQSNPTQKRFIRGWLERVFNKFNLK